jgi:hypothetical protein
MTKTAIAAALLAVLATEALAQGWEFEEGKSKVDDSPWINAKLLGDEGKGGLTFRCFEGTTFVAVFFDRHIGSDRPLVTYRIGTQKAVTERWNVARSGMLVLAPNAITFARLLPENSKLLIRAKTSIGFAEDTFTLGKVGEARDRVGAACKWPDPARSTKK